MPLSEFIEKLGRTIFEAPFGANRISKDAPELAEIRLAVLDEIKTRSHRVAGREVFPYNLVRINLRGIPENQASVFKGAFFSRFFEEELRGGLERANYRFPDDLQVEVYTTPQLPGPKEGWLWVETESREAPAQPVATTPRKPARVVVMKGNANINELVLAKTRTNIGRTVDVYRSDGPSRRNDLAFSEDSEINRTVSREHAHLVFHKRTNEYRIYNDRFYKPGNKNDGGCGLWIIRDGLSQEVHRNARGTRLQHGDEIHLGRAVLKFHFK
ncbi:MAG TPA: FHA domain-containing protein [Bryobacteraceae bacterium]|nr:FHA domain-containing protein [Bryobacteraceae bacterium]